jgi:hypothetical protein
MPGEQQDVTSTFAAPVAGVVFWEDDSALLAGLGFRDAAGYAGGSAETADSMRILPWANRRC